MPQGNQASRSSAVPICPPLTMWMWMAPRHVAPFIMANPFVMALHIHMAGLDPAIPLRGRA